MGFFKGRASFLRLTPGDAAFSEFTQDHLDKLTSTAQTRVPDESGKTHYTWGGGDHSRDSTFSLEKNVVGGALSFDLVVITDRPPPELLQSYYAIELKALSASNPSGFASAKQKREARERARERIEDEARDGRFRRRKCIPIIWDLEHGEILYGATSFAHAPAFAALFLATFNISLDVLTPDTSLQWVSENVGIPAGEDISPAFDTPVPVWSEDTLDYLGSELLLYLWWFSREQGDTLHLSDGSELTFMLSKTLTLDCPLGNRGRETFTHDSPIAMPEARRGLTDGKRPRKAGLIMVRNNLQFEVTLTADDFAVSGLKLPPADDDVVTAADRLEHRVAMLREFLTIVEMLYLHYLTIRFGSEWAQTETSIKEWLNG